jgi:hypothetical protein
MLSKSTTPLVLEWRKRTTEAALQLETRWTYAALRRASAGIADRLHDQRNLFVEACVRGTARQIVEHGEALCRGYAAAVAALEKAREADDAYLLGVDLVTGTKIAVGQQKAAVARIRELHGENVIWITPDEVARIMAGLESFKAIGAVKKLFPGAEILDRYPDEGNLETAYDADPGPENVDQEQLDG